MVSWQPNRADFQRAVCRSATRLCEGTTLQHWDVSRRSLHDLFTRYRRPSWITGNHWIPI